MIGYAPGLFDLFHVGHLDLLRRARESCDHLIAGVIGDELAIELWGREPFVPMPERMDIVGNVKYVDEVVALTRLDAAAAGHRPAFDVLFTSRPQTGEPMLRDLARSLGGGGTRVVCFPGERHSESGALRAALVDREWTSVA